MPNKVIPFVFAATVLLSSCGGGGTGDPFLQIQISTGLKIFVTSEIHNGDFANDPTLSGSTAIQKADAFCNRSTNKPSGDNYKALIVDGINRDAVSLTDWVLHPNTAYYQVYNNVLIDTTTSNAIFAAFFRNMSNKVLPSGSSRGAWTGIGDGATFAANNSCANWGQTGSISGQSGSFGTPRSAGGFAFYSGGSSADCVSEQLTLYCVQQ
jgi:hypothetical protein